jgi:hypothetical protein
MVEDDGDLHNMLVHGLRLDSEYLRWMENAQHSTKTALSVFATRRSSSTRRNQTSICIDFPSSLPFFGLGYLSSQLPSLEDEADVCRARGQAPLDRQGTLPIPKPSY